MTNPPPGFTPLVITPDVDQAPWKELADPRPPHGTLAKIGLLRHGTTGGRATVGLAVQLDNGTWVVAETTWRLFHAAARALANSPIAAEETP